MTAPIPWRSLIEAREAQGVSRYRLAKAMKINLTHLGRLERGEVAPRAGTVRRAAKALGVPVAGVYPGGDTSQVSDAQRELITRIVREELDKRLGALERDQGDEV